MSGLRRHPATPRQDSARLTRACAVMIEEALNRRTRPRAAYAEALAATTRWCVCLHLHYQRFPVSRSAFRARSINAARPFPLHAPISAPSASFCPSPQKASRIGAQPCHPLAKNVLADVHICCSGLIAFT